jgi:hypothetical protein
VMEPSVLLWFCAVAAVPVLAAGLLLRREKIGWGLLIGIILIVAMEGFLFWKMDASSGECVRRTCLAAGRAPDCEPYLGCTEGNGMATLLYQAAGIAGFLLLAAAALWAFLRRRAAQAPKGSGRSE